MVFVTLLHSVLIFILFGWGMVWSVCPAGTMCCRAPQCPASAVGRHSLRHCQNPAGTTRNFSPPGKRLLDRSLLKALLEPLRKFVEVINYRSWYWWCLGRHRRVLPGTQWWPPAWQSSTACGSPLKERADILCRQGLGLCITINKQ